MRRFTLLIAALVALGPAADVFGVTLVQNGQPACVIVVNNNPYPVQEKAAEELQYHLQRMSGAKVPVVRERELPQSTQALVLVGRSERLAAAGIDAATLEPETIIVRSAGNTLILAGDDSGSNVHKKSYADGDVRSGTLYAVYDFLGDQLGCRWLWPGRSGEVIPRRATVEVGDLDIREKPQLFRRHFRASFTDDIQQGARQYVPRYLAAHEQLWAPMQEEEVLWLKRMRMGQSQKLTYGHAFTDWIKKYGKTHPEVLAMQKDGSRGSPDVTYPAEFVKLCVSNPETVEVMFQEFAARRAQSPGYRYVNACENDGSRGFCQCEHCRALDKPLDAAARARLEALGWTSARIEDVFGTAGDGLAGSLSHRYFTFYNNLAKRLTSIAPDATVVAYAYDRYRFAPLGLKLEPNILVGFIGFNFYPMSDAQHRIERENFLDWKRCGAEQLFFRPNSFYYSPAHGMPWSAARQMGGDMEFLLTQGIVSTDFDRLNAHWSTAAPTYYTVARLHWDAAQGAEAVLGEFYQAFGPASSAIAAYFDHWEEVYRAAYSRPDLEQLSKSIDPELGRSKALAVLITEADFSKARGLLAQAAAAAQAARDAELLGRIGVFEMGLQHGELMWRALALTNAAGYDRDVYFAERWPVVEKIFKAREALGQLHAHNVFYLTTFEAQMHDIYGTRVYQDFMGRPYEPVMTPPDTKWVFACDPKGQGEKLGWPQKIAEVPDYFGRNAYEHLFFRDWDNLKAVIRWKSKTGKPQVVNGWYQVDFPALGAHYRSGDVIYLPSIRGTAAKVWVDGRPAAEASAADIAADKPLVVPLDKLGLTGDKPFSLTVRVTSPDGPGGLIGPPYIARPKAG